MFLIERLDALIEQGRRFPGTNAVMVDKVAATDLIEQLRVAVPEEVRQAKRINEESSRLVERAQDEAERVIVQQGADAYAANVLVKLEGEVVKALQSIRRGLSALDERYPSDGSEPSEADPESATDDRTHAQL